jgi:hypothetical protein
LIKTSITEAIPLPSRKKKQKLKAARERIAHNGEGLSGEVLVNIKMSMNTAPRTPTRTLNRSVAKILIIRKLS